MEPSVFALIRKIIVCHGNTSMESNVCISKTPARKAQDGIAHLLLALQQVNVLLAFTEMGLTVNLFPKDVSLLPLGEMENVLEVVLALTELINLATTVSQ